MWQQDTPPTNLSACLKRILPILWRPPLTKALETPRQPNSLLYPPDTPHFPLGGHSCLSGTSNSHVVRTPRPQRPLAFSPPRLACVLGSSQIRYGQPQVPGEGAPARPHSRCPILPGKVHASVLTQSPSSFGPSQGHRLRLAHTRPRHLRSLALLHRAGHSPSVTERQQRKGSEPRKNSPRRLPSATSFIAANPPDSGTAESRWEAGRWLQQPITASRVAL